MLDKLTGANNSRKNTKRVGRGPGSGSGKTSGKGHKGQKARSGNGKRNRIGFEGGQTPLHRRLPKFGFRSRKNIYLEVISLKFINECKSINLGNVISLQELKRIGIVPESCKKIKIIGNSVLNKAYIFKVDFISQGAISSINNSGGNVEIFSIEKT